MPWKYPKRIPQTDLVIDFNDLNDGFLHVVEEDGAFGEQNFSDRTQAQWDRIADLEDDVGLRVVYQSEFIDCSEGVSLNADIIQNTQSWEVIPSTGDVMTLEKDFRGGPVYIIARIQQGAQELSDDQIAYVRLGIRLDGGLEPVLVNGDQDFYEEGENMEIGISGFGMGATIDGTLFVTPGKHTIDIVAQVRNLKNVTEDVTAQIFTKQLFVLEMW